MPAASAIDQVVTALCEQFPYQGRAISAASPNHLAIIATLLGVNPPDIASARVLELGCGTGENLIALAEAAPQATFVGIDLSPDHIRHGNQIAAALGLKNIELRAQSIMDFPESGPPFDYIIAHGVFSWVPEPVRRKLLEIAASQLSETGIAYVSYNALPGRYAFNAARDLMLHHVSRIEDETQKLREARRILQLVVETIPPNPSQYLAGLKEELAIVQQMPDYLVMHDHLWVNNDSFLLTDFVAQAQAAGLSYLGDSSLRMTIPAFLGQRAGGIVSELARNPADAAQYMDFFRGERFRSTLLCHPAVAAVADQKLDVGRLQNMRMAASLNPRAGQIVNLDQQPVSFVTRNDLSLNTVHPVTKAAVALLRQRWPASWPFRELQAASRQAAAVPPSDAVDAHFAGDLLNGFVTGTVRFSLTDDAFTPVPSFRPTASPLARFMAQVGPGVINRRHENIKLNDDQRRIIPLLDGKLTRDGLIRAGCPPQAADLFLRQFTESALLIA